MGPATDPSVCSRSANGQQERKEEKMLSKLSEAVVRIVARFQREEGQALAEYGLILALIAVAAIVALGFLGVAIAGQLDAITAVMP